MAKKPTNITPEVAKARLGVSSFREVKGAQMMQLLGQMDNMSAEARLKVTEQFPSFKEFAARCVDAIDRARSSAVEANDDGQQHAHDAWSETRAQISKELDRDDLSATERLQFLEMMVDTAKHQSELARDNQKFLGDILQWTGMALGTAVSVTALVLVGRGKQG